MKRTLLLLSLLGGIAGGASAQEAVSPSRYYFGVTEGFRTTRMHYSDLNEETFPTSKNLHSGIISVFAEFDLGNRHQFAIRPEVGFLKRGGKLTEIGSKQLDFEEEGIDDIRYTLRSSYVDIRVPLIWQFGRAESKWRPYVLVAPVLGFATSGSVRMEERLEDGSADGYRIDATKANLASTYFALQAGAGIKYQFRAGRHQLFAGLEVSYEYGLTDTYGSKEQDGKADDLLGNTIYQLNGTRKFSGVEVKATLGIPFSVFKKAAPAPAPARTPEPAYVPEPVVEEEPAEEEKPCYTMEEINTLMAQGKSVYGKTICALDDMINFDFGKSTIKSSSYGYLDKLAETLKRTNAYIEIKGHTDNVGSSEFNMNLSKERAQAVLYYLVGKGVSRNRLSYSYYGMTRPIATNSTEEGRKQNRRVEFEILNKAN